MEKIKTYYVGKELINNTVLYSGDYLEVLQSIETYAKAQNYICIDIKTNPYLKKHIVPYEIKLVKDRQTTLVDYGYVNFDGDVFNVFDF